MRFFNRLIYYSLLTLIIPITVSGQIQKKIKEFRGGKVISVGVDRLGDFFLLTNHTIKKYNLRGTSMAGFKSSLPVTLIEPWFHPQIFIYHRTLQTYSIFDRNFENEQVTKLDPSFAVEPFLVCPRSDHSIWILDIADLSIKKADPETHEVLSEFNIDSTMFRTKPEIVLMREYQNMLFLMDRNSGILIFSNIGKLVNRIEIKGLEYFSFFGEELYFSRGEDIQFFDLYTEESKTIHVGSHRFAIVTDESIILVDKRSKVVIYEYRP